MKAALCSKYAATQAEKFNFNNNNKENRTLQTVREIERKVMEVAKEDVDNLEFKTGVKSSLEERDMKKYLEEVMHEVSLSIKSKQLGASG